MRVNKQITVTAGTPVHLVTGLTGATAPLPDPVIVRHLRCQMKTGGTGRGSVMGGIYGGRVPAATAVEDLTAELEPATATAPGGKYEDWDQVRPASIDANSFWVDGSHTGDVILASYDLVN